MKILFTLLIAMWMTPVSAQIVNGNFETWINFQGYLLLQGWEIYAFEDDPSVNQDFDAYEGMYAVEVMAQDTGMGAFGRASTVFSIDYIPPSLEFYVKASSESGSVSVELVYYNGENPIDTVSWMSSEETISEWTFINLTLDQIEEDLTMMRVNISAEAGDIDSGMAVISVDQLTFGSVSGLDAREEDVLQIYPNPATEAMRVGKAAEINRIEIRDMTGKIVSEYHRSNLQTEISLRHLTPACYIVYAHMKSGKIARQKLVLAR